MTGRLPLLLALLALCTPLRAQVVIFNDNLTNGRMSAIQTTVVDSLTREPIPFASVYVIPTKDTTITNFTLTDAKGVAKLDEVPFGSYTFHVEMMGYRPVVRERYFRQEEVDLGTIRLQPDEYFLQAATVTDIGNPIVIKKDTVEFNAASFRVGANAMLKDLLRRMPGMEITDDGKVKFNGEEIDKLTVGGRTFFFNDQSAALNNLPASVVDKIRVIDRESEETRDTGLKTGDREKVLDVALKKEYEKGWFGNVGLKGGSTFKQDEDAVMRQDRGPLFAGNLLASAYSEKDQLTVIGNAQNVDESNMIAVMSDDSGDRVYLNQGLSTAYQLGLNLNTSRIKDVETTVSTSYTFSDTDSGTKTSRTTALEGGDLVSDDTRTGKQYSQKYTADLEFKKETGKFRFRIEPSFNYRHSETDLSGNAQARRADALVNRSETRARGQETSREAELFTNFVFRELGGNEKRSLRLTLDGTYNRGDGTSDENTLLQMAGGQENRTTRYDTDNHSGYLSARVRYIEPLGEKWTVTATAFGNLQRSGNVRDAFDAQGRNDALSTSVNRRFLKQGYALLSQYTFSESSWITLGVETDGILDETRARTYGHESQTGQGEWNWFVIPQMRFEHSWGINRINFTMTSSSSQPGNSRMLPALNISDPARLSLGNIYLKPFTNSSFNFDWRRNNREKFRTLMVSFTGHLRTRPLTEAQWYDADGVFCRLPVNARKPALEMWGTFSYTTPLNAKKTWSLNLYSFITYESTTSYLAHGAVATPDKENFDYAAFMADFWGDASGDRFYGGKSGFEEYRTRTLEPYASVSVKYNQERYAFDLTASASGYISRYTPALNLDRNTLQTGLTAHGTYLTRHEFEFESDLTYVTYRGYSDGFGQPEWQWNASISKNTGAFNLSISAHDILNQTRSRSHTVAANYVEDSYRLVLGRYILFGVKWNFGKMNAVHSQRAQDAAWNMLW